MNKIIRSIEVVTRTRTLVFPLGSLSVLCHGGSKAVMPPLRGNTADSRQFRGKGLASLPYWGNPACLWPEWRTQKALPDYFPPFKHPLFYNPLLLSLSLCVVLKEPVNAPPPPPSPLVEAAVKCWWNPAQHLLIFLPLIFWTEEWGVRRSASSQAFLLF